MRLDKVGETKEGATCRRHAHSSHLMQSKPKPCRCLEPFLREAIRSASGFVIERIQPCPRHLRYRAVTLREFLEDQSTFNERARKSGSQWTLIRDSILSYSLKIKNKLCCEFDRCRVSNPQTLGTSFFLFVSAFLSKKKDSPQFKTAIIQTIKEIRRRLDHNQHNRKWP